MSACTCICFDRCKLFIYLLLMIMLKLKGKLFYYKFCLSFLHTCNIAVSDVF